MDLFVVERKLTHFKDKDWHQTTLFDMTSGAVYHYERTVFPVEPTILLPRFSPSKLELIAPGAVVRPYHTFHNEAADRLFHLLNEEALRSSGHDGKFSTGTLSGFTIQRNASVQETTYQDDED